MRLVDHQPHAAIANGLVAGLDDQVVRQAICLDLLPERVVGPRRGEARSLDAVYVSHVLETHRLD